MTQKPAITKNHITYLLEAAIYLGTPPHHDRRGLMKFWNPEGQMRVLAGFSAEHIGKELWHTYIKAHLRQRTSFLLNGGPLVLDQIGEEDGEYRYDPAPKMWVPDMAWVVKAIESYEKACWDEEHWEKSEAFGIMQALKELAIRRLLDETPAYQYPSEELPYNIWDVPSQVFRNTAT